MKRTKQMIAMMTCVVFLLCQVGSAAEELVGASAMSAEEQVEAALELAAEELPGEDLIADDAAVSDVAGTEKTAEDAAVDYAAVDGEQDLISDMDFSDSMNDPDPGDASEDVFSDEILIDDNFPEEETFTEDGEIYADDFDYGEESVYEEELLDGIDEETYATELYLEEAEELAAYADCSHRPDGSGSTAARSEAEYYSYGYTDGSQNNGLKMSGGSGFDVLLIETNYPWDEETNSIVLKKLTREGYMSGFTICSMSGALDEDFSQYSVVMLANDQTSDSYDEYSNIRVSLERYCQSGGVVLFGACDEGWSSGSFSTELPNSVRKYTEYSNYNYISDSSHPIVGGTLTGSGVMTDDMLYSNYCSHTCFYEDSLPAGSNVILRASTTGDPTLVEYTFGKGHVIASGLTWEYGYSDSHTGEYAKGWYDDLIAYALTLAGVEVDEPTAYDFEYSEDGFSQYLATTSSLFSLLAYRETKKSGVNYVKSDSDSTAKKLLGNVLHDMGYDDLYSYNYDEVGKKRGYVISKEFNQTEHSICYTLGHRLVKMRDGSLKDQIIVVFRGTNLDEWYGNFDVTGTTYDSTKKVHYSFNLAAEDALSNIASYLDDLSDSGAIDKDNLTFWITGHSRGAAVSNLVAKKLSDVKNGTYVYDYSDCGIDSVYAYTFATPNVADIKLIKGAGSYNNIFNVCFTDDFVPNLPMEFWKYGKYGKTYWATAAKLYKKNSSFKNGTISFFGETPQYSETWTNEICKTVKAATTEWFSQSIEYYYTKQRWYDGPFNTMSLYQFIRKGLGGTMRGDQSGKDMIVHAATSLTVSGYFQNFAWALAGGGALDVDKSFEILNKEIRIKLQNIPLNYAHQCGSYYTAMRTAFSNFAYGALLDDGYAATKYDSGEDEVIDPASCNAAQIAELKNYLYQEKYFEEYDQTLSNADWLEWDPEDISTWSGVRWEEGEVTELQLGSSLVGGTLDLSTFGSLRSLECSRAGLTSLDLTGCSALETLICDGNQLESLDLSGCTSLKELNCTGNALTSLDLTGCQELTTLNCYGNLLTELTFGGFDRLIWLDVENNYLNTSAEALQAVITAVETAEDGYAAWQTQRFSEGAVFDEHDLTVLKTLAETDNNSTILEWDLNEPAYLQGITWRPVDGVYYLREVSLQNMGLTGSADFDGCRYLEVLNVSENNFTDISVEDCTSLATLRAEYNVLSAESLTALGGQIAALEEASAQEIDVLAQSQYAAADMTFDEQDVAVLTELIDEHPIEWDEKLLGTNPQLVWEKDENDVCRLTGLSLNGEIIDGEIDLSGLTSMTSVSAAGTDIERIVLPESVTGIADTAFANCESLSQVDLPGTLTMIGEEAFAGCTALRSVTIPETVTQIGAGAFMGCAKLSLITFEGLAPQIGENAFDGCRDTLTLEVGLNISEHEAQIGDEGIILTAPRFPEGDVITWTSSRENVATVDETGLVSFHHTGMALITGRGESGFVGHCKVKVNAVDISTLSLVPEIGPAVFNGTYQNPDVEIEGLIEDTDYYISDVWNNRDVGTAHVELAGMGDYTGTIEVTFEIIPGNLDDFYVELYDDIFTYTGEEICPYVYVDELYEGDEYTISYRDNVNAGTGYIVLTAAGENVTGTRELSFTIEKASQIVTVSESAVSLKKGGSRQLSAQGIGAITYASSNAGIASVSAGGLITAIAPGTAAVTVSAAGDQNTLSGSRTISVTVEAEENAGQNDSGDKGNDQKETAGRQNQRITAPSSLTMKKGESSRLSVQGIGTVTYASSDQSVAAVDASGLVRAAAPGTAVITVSAAGNASYNAASAAITITVNPAGTKLKSVKNTAAKKITVKWKKVSGVTGYEIQYSLKKNFSSPKKTSVKKAKTVKKVIGKLKKGKTYYVRIRTYQTVAGVKYYSDWSASKKVKIKK